MLLTEKTIIRLLAENPVQNNALPFARAIEAAVIERCAERAEAYAYMSPNFAALRGWWVEAVALLGDK